MVPACDLADEPGRTSCVDANPPGAGSSAYFVVALDRAPGTGNLRAGAQSAEVAVIPSDNKPNQPNQLASRVDSGDLWLDWQIPAPASPGYSGDNIRFYRVYRGGTNLSDRLGRTEDGSRVSYKDYGEAGTGGQYWVTAVDQHYSESTPLGPVSAP